MYKIADAERAHIDEIEKLESLCFSDPWTAEQLCGQLRDERHEFIAAFDAEGRVLGYVGMMYVLDEGYISNVAVSPDARRRGIGDALIGELLLRAAKLKLGFVTLEVRAGNEAAKSLYAKHGFTQVGLRKNYYMHPKEDAILMTYYLK